MPRKFTHYGKPRPKKDPRFDWRTIFLKNSGGISSKRVCGLIGWFLCLAIFVWGFLEGKNIPDYGEIVIIISASLLGVDSITSIWLKTITNEPK